MLTSGLYVVTATHVKYILRKKDYSNHSLRFSGVCHSPLSIRTSFSKKFSILLLLLIGFNFISSAQDTTTSDGLFQAARKAAFDDGNFNQAKSFCHKALIISPHYADIQVFLGRLYGWTNELDSARQCFANVLQDKPSYTDATFAYAELEYRHNNYDQSLTLINNGLAGSPEEINLLLLKAKVLTANKQYKQAAVVIDDILKHHKDNAEARAMSIRIRDYTASNKIGVSYDFVHFDKQFNQPWHLSSLSYTRQTNIGSVTGRINDANRFGSNGLQYEVEAYPGISKTFYAYADIGYSDKVGVFPHWRSGFSLYANLPHSFEAEIGWRYLYFTSATNIYTGYIGKYYKNYLFGARTYITPGNNSASSSYSLLAHYYFKGARDYVGVTVGTGISPDDRSISQQLSAKTQLRTYKAGADLYLSLSTFDAISFNASIINQEYLPHTKGNQVQVGVGYQRRF